MTPGPVANSLVDLLLCPIWSTQKAHQLCLPSCAFPSGGDRGCTNRTPPLAHAIRITWRVVHFTWAQRRHSSQAADYRNTSPSLWATTNLKTKRSRFFRNVGARRPQSCWLSARFMQRSQLATRQLLSCTSRHILIYINIFIYLFIYLL
jgi:hypothetical protein